MLTSLPEPSLGQTLKRVAEAEGGFVSIDTQNSYELLQTL